MEAWFGTGTVASLSRPSGAGESSGKAGSGDTFNNSAAPSFGTPPDSEADSGPGALRSIREKGRGSRAGRVGRGAGERRGRLGAGGGSEAARGVGVDWRLRPRRQAQEQQELQGDQDAQRRRKGGPAAAV